ncbi:MAG: GNAT family N-acetyltransferase [Chloroflexia bacterium]
MAGVEVVRAGPEERPALVRFFRAMAAAEKPNDPEAAERAEAGLRRSLEAWDWTRSESCFLFLALVGGEAAGYALAVRIPKADERTGFLFIDELYVLPAFRRRGVARALLRRFQALAGELGLAGVRLLVRPENTPARKLYRTLGLVEHETIFGEWLRK